MDDMKGLLLARGNETCGGWLAWFDDFSVRGHIMPSVMIQVFPLLPTNSAG